MTTEALCSEVTGSVWKLLVKVGDVLEADDIILVLESMKMEIPLMAPDGGRITEILVNEGEAVREGQRLVIIET